MKTLTKLAVPAVFALVAFGAQAQTLETDYPAVPGLETAIAVAPAFQANTQREPLLVQSNFEGITANPAYAQRDTLSRNAVRASATVKQLWAPENTPDRQS